MAPAETPRITGRQETRMDDAEFLKLLTHIHDEMLERVKEQHPSHEQFAAWLLGQIEGRLRMRIGTVKTT
jgi:hypothetical protein